MKILFVCLGNICRSPMAEFIFKDLVNKKGLTNYFEIDSAATYSLEAGSDMYPPAKEILRSQGIPFNLHMAKKINFEDYEYYDLIVCMDFMNLASLNRAFDNDPQNKIIMLLKKNIDDPYYTNDFKKAFDDIYFGCNCLLNDIIKKQNLS